MATLDEDTAATRDLLRLAGGPVDLGAYPSDATPGFDGGKSDGKKALAALADELSDLQEQLFADGRSGGRRRVLLVLQGMDTAGKGGTLRKVAGLLDPQGLQIKAFKTPTDEELRHDFLWRVRREVPEPGMIGIFDRSHYEDVLITRVRGLAPPEEIERRYGAINDFEAELVDDGVTILKCFLHISADEQQERLLARLDDPSKHWKYSAADLDERALWPAYQEAYRIAIERTDTDHAPWYVVPADRKWYRNLAVGRLLLGTLQRLDLAWPAADFDVAAERRRLIDEDPLR